MCIFRGVFQHKGYRCYFPNAKQLHISCHITFMNIYLIIHYHFLYHHQPPSHTCFSIQIFMIISDTSSLHLSHHAVILSSLLAIYLRSLLLLIICTLLMKLSSGLFAKEWHPPDRLNLFTSISPTI